MPILEYIGFGLLGLIGIYLVFRLISIAVLKSWTDLKTKERRDDHADNKTD